jgi:putative ABC transport system substrate-binding protein
LDRIRQGFIETIEHSGLNVSCVYQNAQGNIATATQIAQKFAGIMPRLVVPITTPSAQTVYAAIKDKKISMLFIAVSDPVNAHLVADDTHNLPFVTGVQDAPPFDAQIEQMKKIMNKPIRNVGIIYNPGETNAVSIVKTMTERLEKQGFHVITATAPSTNQVSQAMTSLIDKVDLVYLPNDNTVITAITAVTKIAHTHKIPVFCSDPESVTHGCVASVSSDQYQLGRQAAVIAMRLLKGEKTDTIPYQKNRDIITVVNEEELRHLGLY